MMPRIFLASLALMMLPFSVNAESYDFYVDKNYAGEEIGTQEKPFDSIQEAIAKAEQSRPGLRRIFIGKGEYTEEITLTESIKLFGENKEDTVLKIQPLSTLKLIDRNRLQNLTVSGGVAGLTIQGSATIENCIVKDAKNKGVDLTAGSSLVTIKGSTISNNGGKGLYVQKGRSILLENNIITNNKGEGFDIRQKILGAIINNEIADNTESGIEILSGDSDVMIRNNTVKNNRANGIANQSYPEIPETGKIKISGNTITGNGKYGVYCGSPSGGGTHANTYFSESIFLDGNNNANNTGKPVSGSCHFERQTNNFIRNISSDIEKTIFAQAAQQEKFHELETEIDSRLVSVDAQTARINDMGMLRKIFFGIDGETLQSMEAADQEALRRMEELSALKAESQSETLKTSIENFITSSREDISRHEEITRKSRRMNILFWIPIKITSLFS